MDAFLRKLSDALMRGIEPELTSDMLPLLDAIYAEESPEERRARMERYADACTLFLDRFGEILQTWSADLRAVKEKALREAAQEESAKSKQSLADIDDAMQNV